MAPLSARQEKAQDLAGWLGGMTGVWVVSPLPLDDDTRTLRFQILDSEQDRVVTEICSAGWIPARLQAHPRHRVTTRGFENASLYEIEIPRERQPIVDDRPKIPSEVTDQAKREERKKMEKTIAQFRKAAGL
jgi:hypothetical protein